MMAIEQTMSNTLDTTLPGVLVQMDFLTAVRKALYAEDDDEFTPGEPEAADIALIRARRSMPRRPGLSKSYVAAPAAAINSGSAGVGRAPHAL